MARRTLILVCLLWLIVALPVWAFNFVPAERQQAPEITFLNGEGREVTLDDFEGKVVVVNLWATWCAPCRREMPSLDRLQAEYGGDDLEVVALSQDRGDAVDKIKEFYDEVGVEALSIYRDPTARTARDLRAPGLPTTIVFDRSGQEVGRVLGDAEWDSEPAIQLLEALLRE